MGFGEKIGRIVAPLNYPDKETEQRDSWGAPLPKQREPETEPARDNNEAGAIKRTVESLRAFRAEALGETAVCGVTGGLVLAAETRRTEITE
jgi:hypothetical protein